MNYGKFESDKKVILFIAWFHCFILIPYGRKVFFFFYFQTKYISLRRGSEEMKVMKVHLLLKKYSKKKKIKLRR